MFGRIVALLLAVLGTVGGLALIVVGLLTALGGGKTPEQFLLGTSALPLGVLLLELGLGAAWLARRAAREAAGRPVVLPPWWALALTYVVAVGAAWGALRLGQWWLFLPFATVAVFAPVAAAGRLGLPYDGERPGWARLLPAFAWGAIVTPALAITFQLVAAIGVVLAAFGGLALGGQRYLDILGNLLRQIQGRTLSDAQTEALLRLVATQPLVLVSGAAVLVFAGPVSEELCKFGAALLFARTRADRPDRDSTLTVFLIGLAAGLGFAATENIFYAAQGGATGWTGTILTRAATPLMHGLASALFALGWAEQRRTPGGWALLRGASLAIGLHAAWNFCAGILIVALLFVGTRGTAAGVAVLLLILAFAVLSGLIVASVVTFLRLRRRLAAASLAQADAPPDGPAPGRDDAREALPPVTIPESAWGPPLVAPAGGVYPAERR